MMSPEKPDVFICNKCKERFQKAEYVDVEEDGLLFTRPSCPKCGSTELVVSSWFVEEKK